MKEYKVLYCGWQGYDENDEPEFIGSYEECEEWKEKNSEQLSLDEWYIIIEK